MRADLLAVAALYAAYTASRNAVATAGATAVAHGRSVLRLERLLHVDPERWTNHLLAAHPVLAQLANYDYAIAHFAVTVPVLVVLYRRRGRDARPLVAAWYAANLIALSVFFLFPVAPPRLLPRAGFVDTVVVFHTWGSWGSGAVASASNQFAAMPSLHVAWALWSAVAVWSMTKRRLVRVAAAAYPTLTVLVVLATANHYLLDTLAGGALVAVTVGTVMGAKPLCRRDPGTAV